MTDVLLPVVLLISIVTLAIAIGAFRSSRRSEGLGEDRYELLRNQHDWLEALREERTTLMEALQRETSERRRFMESLRGADPQSVEDLERERQDSARRAEGQEQEFRRLEKELEQEASAALGGSAVGRTARIRARGANREFSKMRSGWGRSASS